MTWQRVSRLKSSGNVFGRSSWWSKESHAEKRAIISSGLISFAFPTCVRAHGLTYCCSLRKNQLPPPHNPKQSLNVLLALNGRPWLIHEHCVTIITFTIEIAIIQYLILTTTLTLQISTEDQFCGFENGWLHWNILGLYWGQNQCLCETFCFAAGSFLIFKIDNISLELSVLQI